jgi:hypothetical protein
MIARLIVAGLLAAALPAPASAEEAVSVGGAYALLNKPASPRAAAILIPGGDGVMNVRPDGTFSGLAGNQLVRTRKAYLSYGIATLTIDRGVDLPSAVKFMRTIAPKVVVVATSRGSLRVPGSLAGQPNGIVLTSSMLDNVRSSIGSPGSLPPSLIVHHRQDGCRVTPPSGVEPFKAWGGAKVSVVWLDGWTSVGDPCEARAYHGFNGIDGKVVSAAAQFITSIR